MDLRRLQFLVRVIDTGSITRAAAALRIAQPALSQHMQTLERSAGTQLLFRQKDGVTPTEAGLIAYRNAKLLTRQLERARLEVRTLAAVPTGRVTVGIAPHSHARRLIQPLLRSATDRYPEILLHISENFEGVLANDLRMGRMDMALLYETTPRPGFKSQPIAREPLYLVGQKRLLGPASAGLTGTIPMLLPSELHAIRQLVEAVYSRRRIRPLIVAEIESFETLAASVAEGLGATALPLAVATVLAGDYGLTLRQLGSRPTFITLVLATAEDSGLSDA
ncbi:MAG: LysR substrate-binding domain-containing protein, partial [Janthinobacterium lividum]